MTDDIPNVYQGSWAQYILAAMQGKHVYEGTVPADVKAKRRAKNKLARKSRRNNR
jgi:hypothetical protein